MSYFALGSLAGVLTVASAARWLRSRFFALFVLVLLGIQSLIASGLRPHVAPLGLPFDVLQAVVFVHFLLLIRPRMRPLPYRALVSIPASFFVAGTLLAFPWAIAAAFGAEPWLWWLPYAVTVIGIAQSLYTMEEEIDLTLCRTDAGSLKRWEPGDAVHARARPLRIIQITDPHLGAFMSERRLRRICERAVARQPDLVLLTGDFLTMESRAHPEILEHALTPLKALEGRTFACRGNHDFEAPELVDHALRSAGIRLLIDEATLVETRAGRVQVVGIDFRWRGRKRHMDEVCARHPREANALRLVLLHDPGAFARLASGQADLVLSGHTHGGQLGLVSLGLKWTALRLFVDMPDHGLWAQGANRLYVHRGTGHYGFPLRLGVPAEQSMLRIHRDDGDTHHASPEPVPATPSAPPEAKSS